MEELDLSAYNHKLSIPLRYMDFDAMKHVNNARFLNFLEEARIAYWQDVLGSKLDSLDFNAVVARVEIDYKSSIFFGDDVIVYSRVSRIGNKSLTYECSITTEGKGKRRLAALSKVIIVKLGAKSLKPVKFDEKIKDLIRNFETLSK